MHGRTGEVLTLRSHDTGFDVLVEILVMVMELVVVRSSVVGVERGDSVQVQHKVLPVARWSRVAGISRKTHCRKDTRLLIMRTS